LIKASIEYQILKRYNSNRPKSVFKKGGVKVAKEIKKGKFRKAELVEIAETLFLEKGYNETSIEDILDASSLSKGGFYHYFKSKEEVLSESIKMLMQNTRLELEPIVNNEELDALSKLKLFWERKNAVKKHKKKYAAYLGMLMKSDFLLYKFYVTLAQEYVDLFAKIIEQGAKEGVFKVKYPRETADILLRAVTSLPQSTYFDEYANNEVQQNHYSAALIEVISNVLGIDSKELQI
jgi:AcrR family transcriptional regulator